MKYTTIVAATASEAAPLQYLGKSIRWLCETSTDDLQLPSPVALWESGSVTTASTP